VNLVVHSELQGTKGMASLNGQGVGQQGVAGGSGRGGRQRAAAGGSGRQRAGRGRQGRARQARQGAAGGSGQGEAGRARQGEAGRERQGVQSGGRPRVNSLQHKPYETDGFLRYVSGEGERVRERWARCERCQQSRRGLQAE
jgi:hypothetical protein